jgi:hypothetical protein
MNYTSARHYTNKLHELADEGLLSWETIAKSCLQYMSEADVEDMALSDGLIEEEEEEEENLPYTEVHSFTVRG